MFLEISGRPAKTPINIVDCAAKFFCEYLLGTKLSSHIHLTIEFERFEKGCNDYAYCDWIDDNHRSRMFIITIDRTLSRKETILALAHEMVHLKQYARGELKDIFRPAKMTKWMGKKYVTENMDYWETPWEIEAYGREKGLYMKFLDHIKNDDTL